jgi:hypothetical protein
MSDRERVAVSDLTPGAPVVYGRTVRIVASVATRWGFSGPLAVIVQWRGGAPHTVYAPTARVTLDRS